MSKVVHTSICSNSVYSVPSRSAEFDTAVLPGELLPIGFGPLTIFLSGEAGLLIVTGEAGRIQLSNMLDRRFCEMELRQSFGGTKGLMEDDAFGLDDRPSLAVPPDSSSSSSSSVSSISWRLARRLTVSSDGSKDAVDDERDFERRYHSSGTHIRKYRTAARPNGFALNGASTMVDRVVLNGMRVVPSNNREYK